MNGIERITGRIRDDAQAEADRRLDAARASADKILADYRARAESESKALTEKNDKNAAAREERLISMANMDARKAILAARQDMLERAYVRALDILCSMPREESVKALADLIAQAASTGHEEVIFNAKDQKEIGEQAVGAANQKTGMNLILSQDTANIRGGFILRDKNIEVNGSFETLVRLQKNQTAGEVAKLLFDPSGAAAQKSPKANKPAPVKIEKPAQVEKPANKPAEKSAQSGEKSANKPAQSGANAANKPDNKPANKPAQSGGNPANRPANRRRQVKPRTRIKPVKPVKKITRVKRIRRIRPKRARDPRPGEENRRPRRKNPDKGGLPWRNASEIRII